MITFTKYKWRMLNNHELKRIFFSCGIFWASALMLAARPATLLPFNGNGSANAKAQLTTEWRDSVRRVMADVYQRRVLTIGNLTMPLHWQLFGDCPPDGRALYISLHGGGGTAPEVNDQQWQNQTRLYRPKDCVYLCPRSPFNTWDLHFKPELDTFYQHIIMMAVAYLDVNPDKVYIMGYSAGGDGVWRLAPRLADHWAAASMMAGHPGDVSLVNLLNTPFMIWCGADDAAYDRNRLCGERIAEMDSLQRDAPDGYLHEGHIMAGMGHWMNRADTVAVDWMAQHRRNPYPRRIVWRQEAVPQQHFYWLSAPADELRQGKEVRAELKGNTIVVSRCDYTSLTISLNDQMLNLDKPVKVVYGGKTRFKGRVRRSSQVMRATLFTRNDPSFMFPAQIHVKLKN